ncbi:MAG: putative threonine efflux protein [Idiomarinaceae bacterium HL-53]|nr:MAG: putative threonine efflux protein [Idiomarinaceae bacterium HL-53]CUS49035.1 Threonine/homoserine/homoserine lactone efflux protein [Idiomarinaceae bacterium HL-53]
MSLQSILSSPYFVEFTQIAILHFLAVVSPGPDFAVVSRFSLRQGARIGVWLSLGIALGILIHVAYSILGLALVISQTPWLYRVLTLAAVGYFIWLGGLLIRSKPNNSEAVPEQAERLKLSQLTTTKAVWLGFITNALNIKATFFFLALFTTVISFNTPAVVKVGYGLYLAFATFTWFACLSLLLGKTRLRQWLLSWGYWFDRLMGVLLLGIAGHFLLQLLKT